MKASEIQELIKNDRLAEALAELNELINNAADGREGAELYYLRGNVHRRMGQIPAAITDYEHAVALDPSSPAAAALEMCNDILGFFNPDQFNP